MTSALGIDIGGVDDVDATLNFATGRQTVGESILTTLSVEPGDLWWAPTLGYDLKKHLHIPFDEDTIERNSVRQAELDERVKSASATASQSTDGKTITLVMNIELVDETETDLELTITVDQLGGQSAVIQ